MIHRAKAFWPNNIQLDEAQQDIKNYSDQVMVHCRSEAKADNNNKARIIFDIMQILMEQLFYSTFQNIVVQLKNSNN